MALNKRRWALAAVTGASIMVCAVVWSGRKGSVPCQGAGLSAASGGPSDAAIAATGRIECRREAEVRSKAAGRVRLYAKKDGDWAEKGEAVVRLDDSMERAALKEAQAQLFQSGKAFERLKTLASKGVASVQELDNADAAHRLASARVEKAESALEDRVVRAPFTGRILRTYLETGETAAPHSAEPLFVIGDDRTLLVTAEVDELDIARLSEGSKALVYPDALPGESFPGKVVRIARMLGRKSIRSDHPSERMDAKVLEVEIELPRSERLRPGVSVQVKIEPGSAR